MAPRLVVPLGRQRMISRKPESARIDRPSAVYQQPATAAAKMVTLRAVGIAVILMPLTAWWIIRMEVIRYAGHPTTISLFFNVVFVLAVLLLINAGIRRV